MGWKLYTDNFMVEATRICNLSCQHCLRGDYKPIQLSIKTLKDFFNIINYKLDISSLIYTGGEPGVDVKHLYRLHDIVVKYSSYANIFISTNGYNFHDLVLFFISAFKDTTEGEYSMLRLSDSQFHQMSRGDTVRDLYEKYSHLFKYIEYQDYLDERYLINSGYAKDQYDNLEREPFNYCDVTVYNGSINFDMIYLTAKGRITFGCNMSYEMEDRLSISFTKFAMFLDALYNLYSSFQLEVDEKFILALKKVKTDISLSKLIKKHAVFD